MILPPIDVAVLIRDVNASNEAVEDQCLRARQAADIANRSACTADLSAAAAVRAEVAHRTIQAERPRQHAPLPSSSTQPRLRGPADEARPPAVDLATAAWSPP